MSQLLGCVGAHVNLGGAGTLYLAGLAGLEDGNARSTEGWNADKDGSPRFVDHAGIAGVPLRWRQARVSGNSTDDMARDWLGEMVDIPDWARHAKWISKRGGRSPDGHVGRGPSTAGSRCERPTNKLAVILGAAAGARRARDVQERISEWAVEGRARRTRTAGANGAGRASGRCDVTGWGDSA